MKLQKKQQGHTSGVDPQERYYYHTASIDGRVFRIDLDQLDIDDADYIDIGGYPTQAISSGVTDFVCHLLAS
jgi:hypothetical protein